MRTVTLVGLVCMACGADPNPGTVDGGGDAGADATGDRWTGYRPECQLRRMLDCNNDGTCDTPTGDANCGACGRACPSGEACDTTGTRCF